jgi:hypothetical protein
VRRHGTDALNGSNTGTLSLVRVLAVKQALGQFVGKGTMMGRAFDAHDFEQCQFLSKSFSGFHDKGGDLQTSR